MLDQVDLSDAMPKEMAKQLVKLQIERLFDLQQLLYERKVPVIVVFEGWDAAGKGTVIRRLTSPLDPRGFKVLATQAPRTHEQQKPWLWRFWMNLPRRGQMAIFDRSWYGRVLVERVEGLTPIPDWIRAYEEINAFERTLVDDGTVIVKFWLHISKEEQLRRFILLTADRETAWQVTAEDWEHHRKYDEYLAAVRDMLSSTHTPCAPWEVVPATDRAYKEFCVLRALIARLEEALDIERTTYPAMEALEAALVAKQVVKAAKKAEKASKKAEKKTQKQDAQAAAKVERASAKAAKAARKTAKEQPTNGAGEPATSGAVG